MARVRPNETILIMPIRFQSGMSLIYFSALIPTIGFCLNFWCGNQPGILDYDTLAAKTALSSMFEFAASDMLQTV